MRTASPDCNGRIFIGYQGENEATQVAIDVTGWQELYGSGSFTLVHRRSGDDGGYPIVPTLQGETLLWNVTNSDTANKGHGALQVLYIVDEVIAKSITFVTITGASVDDSADPPDPFESYVETVIEAKEDAENAAERAEAAAASIVTYTFTDAASDGNIVISEIAPEPIEPEQEDEING